MSVNKVILLGFLGNDPEMYQGGSTVTKFSLATSEVFTKDGQRQEKTEWHRCVAFGRTAEVIAQYLKKGSKVYIEGKIQTSKYTDNQGIERYSTDIIVNSMQMLDSKEPRQNQEQRQNQAQNQAPKQSQKQNNSFDAIDDSIPF